MIISKIVKSNLLASYLRLTQCPPCLRGKNNPIRFSCFHAIILIVIVILSYGCSSCNDHPVQPPHAAPAVPVVAAPIFNEDSAYSYVKTQCDFGPRKPNTKAHDACAEYLISKLKMYTPEVVVQKSTVMTFDNVKLNIQNIIASFNPAAKNRILLFAHWDTRPWADQDSVKKDEPILGADDAGSGVGILLEVARQLSIKNTSAGIDIAFFDAEDWGTPETMSDNPDSYALGTQYWANNPHVAGYTADYGILLDMTGARNATFLMEGNSLEYAPAIVKKVWEKALATGYSGYFIFKQGGYITDDHVYVNNIRNIPSIDIINTSLDGRFGSHWHTHRDNMELIDKATLKAVGQTILEVIYSEPAL